MFGAVLRILPASVADAIAAAKSGAEITAPQWSKLQDAVWEAAYAFAARRCMRPAPPSREASCQAASPLLGAITAIEKVRTPE
jgi:hypothetical protein